MEGTEDIHEFLSPMFLEGKETGADGVVHDCFVVRLEVRRHIFEFLVDIGEVLGDEVVNPNKKNLSKNREKIGMVFQSYDLFPHLTILQNVTLAPIKVKKRNRAEVEKEALELLDRVGLLSKKDNYPRQLSGGQKQRVAIVR